MMKKFLPLWVVVLSLWSWGGQLIAQNTFELTHFPKGAGLLQHQNALWVLGDGDNYHAIRSMDEGKTWSVVKPNDGTLRYNAQSIVFKDKLYSIGGKVDPNGTAFSNEVNCSSDGVHWTSYDAPFAGRLNFALLLHNDAMYIIGGEKPGHSSYNDVWCTTDGINWEMKTNTLSADFPHFYAPDVSSVNGKLILTGGSNNGFGTLSNERGVYISDDHGTNWIKHEFPFATSNLKYAKLHFVYNDKLYLSTRLKVFRNQPEFAGISREEARLVSTEDGVNWEVESELDHNILTVSDETSRVIVTADNQIKTYVGNASDQPIYSFIFEVADFKAPSMAGVFVNDNAIYSIAFKPEANGGSSGSDFVYCIKSSSPNVILVEDIVIDNGMITLSPSGFGESKITVEVCDGDQTENVGFVYCNYPTSKVYLHPIDNQIVAKDGDLPHLKVSRYTLDGYGENTYTVTSSNEELITSSSISVVPFFYTEVLSFDQSVNTDKEGETLITITATDGVSMATNSFWLKIGEDEDPIQNSALEVYKWDPTIAFDYDFPNHAFVDPDGKTLSYSADNLPCGLSINPSSGNISGNTDEPLPFEITIIATDRYSNKATAVLRVEELMTEMQEDQTEVLSFTFHPNPAKDQISIHLAEDVISNVSILNMNGILIQKKENINKTRCIINTKTCPGLYLIKIEDSRGGVYYQKMMVR